MPRSRGAARPAARARAEIAAGTTYPSRHEPLSASSPITGLPAIQATDCEPTTQPMAHGTRSGGK